MTRLFERQKRESEKAFEAFSAYQNMGTKRSLVKAERDPKAKNRGPSELCRRKGPQISRMDADDGELNREALGRTNPPWVGLAFHHCRWAGRRTSMMFERRPKETEKAFEAFSADQNTGTKRSLVKVAKLSG